MTAQKFLLLISFLFFYQITLAQDTQAESLFNNAATFMAAGKYQDALTDYQTIVDKYGDSGWADNALLEIGHFYRTTEKNEEEALAFYTKIKDHFPQSESAAAAYYFSSLIREKLALNREELDYAGNDLVRMTVLYPGSEWEADALFLMGKINYRLNHFQLARSYFQQLLLYYPQASFIPESFILRSKIAYLAGQKKLALDILSRMQTKYSFSDKVFNESTELARLIEKMSQARADYTLDRGFPASTPKTYKTPRIVQVDSNGLIGVIDNNGIHFLAKGQAIPAIQTNQKEAVEFCLTPDGSLALGSKRNVTLLKEGVSSLAPVAIDELKGVAIDNFGRYYILEARKRDVSLYDRKGTFLAKLDIERIKKIRCRGQELWVLGADGSSLIRYSEDLKNLGAAISLNKVKDFCFDSLGNLYVLYEKGAKLVILSREGKKKGEMDFRNGSYPLRLATSIAVDQSGFIYLVDSKGGAIYRFY